jgi:hypothetical protein
MFLICNFPGRAGIVSVLFKKDYFAVAFRNLLLRATTAMRRRIRIHPLTEEIQCLR